MMFERISNAELEELAVANRDQIDAQARELIKARDEGNTQRQLDLGPAQTRLLRQGAAITMERSRRAVNNLDPSPAEQSLGEAIDDIAERSRMIDDAAKFFDALTRLSGILRRVIPML